MVAIATLLVAVVPSPGFGGGSDEPGYTGGSGGNVSNPGSGPVAPNPVSPDPEPAPAVEQSSSAATLSPAGLTNRLAVWWLTIEATLGIF